MTLKILIVGDMPETVLARLRVAGHVPLVATSGQQALALAEDRRLDVIVLDEMLPDMDGAETCRRLRMNPVTATIPVILVSSRSAVEARAEGLRAGATDYVTRPVDGTDLLARITRLTRFDGEISLDHWRLLEGMAYTASTVLPCKLSWIFTITPDGRWLVHQVLASDDGAEIAGEFYDRFHDVFPDERLPLVRGDNVLADVALAREVLINVPISTLKISSRDRLQHVLALFEFAYVSIVPLISAEQVVGVMVLAANGVQLAQSPRAQQILNLLTAQAAMIVDNARLLEHLAQRDAQMQAEQAFRQLVMDTMGEGLIVIDEELMITYVNNRLLMLAGYRREAIYGRNVGLLFHPRTREQLLYGLTRQDRTLSFAQELYTSAGETVPVLISRVLAPAPSSNIPITVIVVTDLSELQRNEHALHLQTRRLQAINDATNAISSVSTIDDVVRITLEAAQQTAGSVSAALLLRDPEDLDAFVTVYAVGPHAERARQRRAQVGLGFSGRVAEVGQSRLVLDLNDDAALQQECLQAYGPDIESLLAVPLVAFDEVIGVIEVLNKVDGRFDQHDLSMLESLAGSAAITIENTRLFEQTRRRVTELSTLLDASSAVTSTLDFGDILERIARQLSLVLKVERVVIADWQRQPNRLVTLAELVNAYWTLETGPVHDPSVLPLTGETLYMGRIALARSPSYEDAPPLVERNPSGLRAIASFPLHIGGQLVGALTLYSERARDTLSPNDVAAVLEALVHWQNVVDAYAPGDWLLRPNLTELCQRVLQVIKTRWCAVMVYDAESECVRVLRELGYALWQDYAHQVWRGDQYPIFASVLETGAPLVVHAAHLNGVSAERDYLERVGGQTGLITPLFRHGEPCGVIQLIDSAPERVFDNADISLGQGIANVVGNAIENAQLYTAQRQRASALEAAYKDLQEADQMKEALLQNLSHELRTPLTHILGYLQLMLDGTFGILSGEQQQTVQLVTGKAQQLADLVRDIVSVQDAQQHNIIPKPIHLDRVIATAIRAVAPKAQEQGIRIVPRIPGNFPLVYADPVRVGEVFEELLENAIKFSPQSTSIEVMLTDPGGLMVQVSVRDHGIGIAESEQEKIFRRFYQVDSGTTRHFGGTGLGLTIVQQVIEGHNGRVWVESSPGKGSCFKLTLPKARSIVDEI